MPEIELETPDPIAALDASSIAERAAGVRDLSKIGLLDHLPRLVRSAQNDRSPAVRLGTASAAADILSRHRLPPHRSELTLEHRQSLLALFRGIDPGVNAGLFPMLACLDLPQSFQRISTGLRDPRIGVRVGAEVGLTRLCQSAAHFDDAELEQQIVALLDDTRLRPDAVSAVARICLAGGYGTARPRLSSLSLPGQHGEVVSTCLERFDALDAPLTGAWRSDGLDAGEVNPTPSRPPALVICTDRGWLAATPRWKLTRRSKVPAVRRMVFRRIGQPQPGPVFQTTDRTWYPATPAEVAEHARVAIAPETIDWARGGRRGPGDDLAAEVVPSLLGKADRVIRALLIARSQGLAETLAALETACAQPKAPAELQFYLGEALAAAGRSEDANAAWTRAKRRAATLPEWCARRLSQRLES